jgi:hypothetical protein
LTRIVALVLSLLANEPVRRAYQSNLNLTADIPRRMAQIRAPFLRDPITVSRRERIEHYRVQAARYRQLAASQAQVLVREGLLDLALQCEAMVEALEVEWRGLRKADWLGFRGKLSQ